MPICLDIFRQIRQMNIAVKSVQLLIEKMNVYQN